MEYGGYCRLVNTPPSIATLRISLDHITPEIWRTFTVPTSIELVRLHDVVQAVMGWTDSHLHEFVIHGQTYGDLAVFTEHPETIDEAGTTFHQLGLGAGDSLQYIYDMGDFWRHRLEVMAIKPLTDDMQPFMIIDGACACPPEDVVGTGGFEQFCVAMKDRSHPEHKEYRTWYGGPFHRLVYDRPAAQQRLDALIASGKGYPWEV